VIRAYKFLLRPTARQTVTLGEMLRDHCSLYNGALEHRRTAYHRAGVTIRYGEQSAELKAIRADDPGGQGRWSFSSQQATLRRLDKAFAAFFRRIKAGQTPGYPRFKGAGHFDTVVFPKDGGGCRWDATPHDPQTRIRLQGVGHVRVHQHRPVAGRVRTKAHRAAARKVAKLYAKIRRQRLDFHHKTARALVQDHDVIAHERLNTAGMTRKPRPKPDPDSEGAFLLNGAAAKAGLNRSILDAGWGQFLAILADKAESAGRLVIPVDARNTSRTCPPSAGGCGHISAENRPTQARFQCTTCGFTANADHVGATNVLNRAGLALCDVA
jgi:putative transposase